MGEKLDPKDVMDFKEPRMSNVSEKETLINQLAKKGIIVNEMPLAEIKKLKGKRPAPIN